MSNRPQTIQTMLIVADLVHEAQVAAKAAYWWSLHRDWVDQMGGLELNVAKAYRLGRAAIELWEGSGGVQKVETTY